MTTKLTLAIEKDILDQAKAYARKNGCSLTELVESYLKILVQKDINQNELSPGVKRLLGSVKITKDVDFKKELENVLNEKYSK